MIISSLTDILGTNSYLQTESGIGKKSYGYEYPSGHNFKPGSEIHDKLVKEIVSRAWVSRDKIKVRFDQWTDTENTLRAYIPTDAYEKQLKWEDSRKPISMVIPVSYAVKETLLANLLAAFIKDPIHSYIGQGPEDAVGAALMERAVALQCNRNRVALAMFRMLSDDIIYGLAPTVAHWKTDWNYRQERYMAQAEPSLEEALSGEFRMEERTRTLENLAFEGNALKNVDPRYYLPDPNVAADKVQDGEYVGWMEQIPYVNLLETENRDRGLFNVKYLRDLQESQSFLRLDMETGRNNQDRPLSYTSVTRSVDVIYMYIKIIPKEWGLGGHNPERWFFAVGNDRVLLQARKAEFNHDMFPVSTLASNGDGYSGTPTSRLEMISEIQTTANYYVNSGVAHDRKSLNDTYVVDPSMISMKDLLDPKPGKIIRVKPRYFGKSVKDAITQYPSTNVTKDNMAMVDVLLNIVNRVTGAVDAMQGVQRTGSERVTAMESSNTFNSALGRVGLGARVAGMTVLWEHAYMFAHNTQQFGSKDQWIPMVLGGWNTLLRETFGDVSHVQATIGDLNISFDVKMPGGEIPSSGNYNAALQVYRQVAADPELRGRFDLARLLERTAQMAGFSNLHDFTSTASPMQMQVQPDEQVAQAIQAGNGVPIQ